MTYQCFFLYLQNVKCKECVECKVSVDPQLLPKTTKGDSTWVISIAATRIVIQCRDCPLVVKLTQLHVTNMHWPKYTWTENFSTSTCLIGQSMPGWKTSKHSSIELIWTSYIHHTTKRPKQSLSSAGLWVLICMLLYQDCCWYSLLNMQHYTQ